jgi:hypothetical protein
MFDFSRRQRFCQLMTNSFIFTLKKALTRTFEHAPQLFKDNLFELTGIFLSCELLDQYFKKMGQIASEIGGQSLPSLLGRLLTSLLLMVLLTHWVPLRSGYRDQQGHRPNLWAFIARHISPFSLESLRALGLTLLYLPLLIIPGLIKYVQFLFVPFVVLCDRKYQRGQVDALAESKRLTKGLEAPLLMGLVAALFAGLWMGQFTEKLMLTETPLLWLGVFVTSTTLNLYFNILLFQLYVVRTEDLAEVLE